jgi:hypothetical protein
VLAGPTPEQEAAEQDETAPAKSDPQLDKALEMLKAKAA